MKIQYDVKPYPTNKRPKRQLFLFTLLIFLLSKICMIGQKYKIRKVNMKGLKPPYILLSNHMYFVDFYLNAIATFPHSVNNVATIDGYYRRPKLMEWLGCICKRKFTNDLSLIRSIMTCLKRYRSILSMYPEARYSPIGTTAILPDSLGKLIKKADVPVVTLMHHGNYLHTPFWDHERKRKVPLCSVMTQILSVEDIRRMDVEEINRTVREAMQYDEYTYQSENNLHITEPYRAENLHKVLYKCPHCGAEAMTSSGITLSCTSCGKVWEMDTLGRLNACEGKTEFPHIPDWYEWQRQCVREEIESGSYSFDDEVDVYSLTNPKEFIHVGKARLIHNYDGFTLSGTYRGQEFEISRPALGMYGLHVEYDYVYVRPEDCLDISTEDDSLYCYPTKKNVVTKLSLATEELYRWRMAHRSHAAEVG